MMGCRYGAKSTLDLTYLYLAEKRGAMIFPETKVVNVEPLDSASDGSAGYEISTVKSTAWIRRQPRTLTCRGLVFLHPHWAPWNCCSVSKITVRYATLAGVWASGWEPIPSRSWGRHAGVHGPFVARHSDRPGIYIGNTRTLKRCAIPAARTRWAFSRILTDRHPGARRIRLWLQNALGSLLFHPIKTARLSGPKDAPEEHIICCACKR